MKKLFCVLLAALLLTMPVALAETSDDLEAQLAQKDAQIADLEAKLAQLQAQVDQLSATPEPTPEPTPALYQDLAKGSKGEAVVALQDRLKELGYLGGKSDGAYGGGTAGAVSDFQTAAGLQATGKADAETQAALFAPGAPYSPNPVPDEALYESLDYKANARDPEGYTGTKVKFNGKIVQVMEDDGYAAFRIATKGNYDNVIYALYKLPENYKRFLEDDKVTVYATSTGVYSYETVMGATLTIPSCIIDKIELR